MKPRNSSAAVKLTPPCKLRGKFWQARVSAVVMPGLVVIDLDQPETDGAGTPMYIGGRKSEGTIMLFRYSCCISSSFVSSKH